MKNKKKVKYPRYFVRIDASRAYWIARSATDIGYYNIVMHRPSLNYGKSVYQSQSGTSHVDQVAQEQDAKEISEAEFVFMDL